MESELIKNPGTDEFKADELSGDNAPVLSADGKEVTTGNADEGSAGQEQGVSLGQWLKNGYDKYFGTRPVQTDEDREYNARQKQKMGQWGRLVMALGNAYTTGKGGYSATIPADTTEKTIGDWKTALKEQKAKQAALDAQNKQYWQKMRYNYDKLAQDAKNAQDKIVANALEKQKDRDSRESIAISGNESRERMNAANNATSTANNMRTNATSIENSKRSSKSNNYDEAIVEGVADWNVNHPDDQIKTRDVSGTAIPIKTLAIQLKTKQKMQRRQH